MKSQPYSSPSNFVRILQSFNVNLIYETGRRLIKRLFDVIMVLIGLIILAPVFVFIPILIKYDSPGPVFYWGSRMGRGGKPFKMLKFRTMYERPESYEGPVVTVDGDDRITPLGHWLRDTKINELPQLWNVLRGEMSLVGPRPEDVGIAKTWPKDAFEEILSVRPGITSPTSVLYHDEEKLLSRDNLMLDYLKRILPDKIRLDRVYVRHHSFFSDIDVIFWTIAIIIPQLSKTKIPEGYLFAGPIFRFIHRYVNWFLVDLIVSMSIAYFASLIFGIGEQSSLGTQQLALAFSVAFLFSGYNSIVGLNRVLWSEATIDDAIGLIISSIVVTTLIWILNYINAIYQLLSFLPLPTIMIFFIGIAAGFGFLLVRYRLRLLASVARRWLNWRQEVSKVGERVLIVGLGEGNKIANYLLKRRTFRTAFSIVGVVDNNNPSHHGMRVSGNWMLGGINDIPTLIKRYDVGMILSTLPHHNPENEHILELCQISHTKLIFLDDILSITDRQVTRPTGKIDNPLWVDGHLEYKAMHDTVTGLPNRYLLQDRLEQALTYAKRYKTQPALIFIEMDGISNISNMLGNKSIDQAIIAIVERIEKCKRESDTLARFGSDKFALFLDNVASEQDAEVIVQRIFASLPESFNIKEQKFLLSHKIGLCLCDERTCGAFNTPQKVEIVRCYGCAMSKIMTNKKEAVNVYENILAK